MTLRHPPAPDWFDEAGYRAESPDVARAVRWRKFASGWSHFATIGIEEVPLGRPLPTKLGEFVEVAYLQANPDVADEVEQGAFESGIDHFVQSGWADVEQGRRVLRIVDPDADSSTGRHERVPWFDEAAYLDASPDVARAVERRRLRSGLDHFIRHGISEVVRSGRRLPTRLGEFVEADYLRANPDVAALVASGAFKSGVMHFARRGWEGVAAGTRNLRPVHDYPVLISSRAGQAKPGGRWLVLFAHYDLDGLIDPHVLHHLRTLHDYGAELWVITAADDPTALAEADPLVSRWLIKSDAGRDFGSWALALDQLDLEDVDAYERIVVANDSIYFPLFDPANVFDALSQSTADAWGLTESLDRGRHLQSYWLALTPHGFKIWAREFLWRWRNLDLSSKLDQIEALEIGLCRYILSRGLTMEAYASTSSLLRFPVPQLISWRHGGADQLNPTHDLWKSLVETARAPLIKVELLHKDPKNTGAPKKWKHLKDVTPPARALVEAHLERLG